MKNFRKFIFVGESGSGKTELALNLALCLAHKESDTVYFFDMDQTKGLFRARDRKDILEAANVALIDTVQFLDSPIVPAGVSGYLEENNICIFDVGGDAIGARMIGQYASALRDGQYCYVINPNRPFSSNAEELKEGIERILSAGRISPDQVQFISNPCLGSETSLASILWDHQRLTDELGRIGKAPQALIVKEGLFSHFRDFTSCPVYPIRLYIKELYTMQMTKSCTQGTVCKTVLNRF